MDLKKITYKIKNKKADIHWDQIAWVIIALAVLFIAVVALGLYRKEILGILGRIIKAIKFGGIE